MDSPMGNADGNGDINDMRDRSSKFVDTCYRLLSDF